MAVAVVAEAAGAAEADLQDSSDRTVDRDRAAVAFQAASAGHTEVAQAGHIVAAGLAVPWASRWAVRLVCPPGRRPWAGLVEE